MGFYDVIPNYFGDDEEDDPEAQPRPRRFRDSGNPADERQALQETTPETQGYAERFVKGALHDVGQLGEALASPLYYGAREVYRTAHDPAAQAEKYRSLIAGVAADPYGAAQKVASAAGSAAEGLVEPYQRREGEGFLDVAKRNVLDRPLGTLMDTSALVGIPAGLADRAGIAGAEGLANAARAVDPITLAGKAGRGLLKAPDAARTLFEEGPLALAKAAIDGTLKTSAPDAIARMEAERLITDQATAQRTRGVAVHNEFRQKSAEVFRGIDPTDKSLFFPYVEGRLKMMNLGPEGIDAGLAELSPSGEWLPRGISGDRLARLEDAKQKYLPILDQFETQMGYKPEQVAAAKVQQHQAQLVKQGQDPLAPEHQQSTQQVYDQALQDATDRQVMRRTLSTRTSLDTMKEKAFTAKVEELKLSQGADAANEYAAKYPVQPATPEEAMQVWGPQGGVYFPHSGEVFTRDQVNMGNLLTKVREAVPWKQNKGTLFRTGALDTMDPEKALLRTAVGLRGGSGRAEIMDALGQKFGEKLEGNYKFGSDPDFRAGTHQLLRPGLLHQDAALGEHMHDLMTTLLHHADDPAVAGMNLADLTEKAAANIDTHYPLRGDSPVYKVPKGVADAIANFSRSLEPSTNPVAPWLDAAADPFHFVTLQLRPARILNNMIGNTTFQVLQGIHPFSSTGIGAISDMVKAVAYKAGLTGSEKAGQLAKVFDLPGVASGGMTGADEYASRTATLLKNHPLATMLGGKQLAAYGETMSRLNEHVESTARALSTLFELRKQSPGLLGRMASTAKSTMDLGDRVEQLAGMGAKALDETDYSGALKNVNRFLNDYGRTSPFERTVLRRIFPYQKFYKHSVDLALKTPFEQPAKTALLRTIGKAAQQDFNETLSGWGFDPQTMVKPWQQDQVPISVDPDPITGQPQVKLLNLTGPSPFSMLTGRDPGQQGLGAIHPALKAAAEWALGINLFTGEHFHGATSTFSGKEVDPFTGLVDQAIVRPGPIAQFAKQFFPVQIAKELLAGNRQPLDTSSLLDQFMADHGGTPGSAYQVDDRGQAITRPKANPFARLFLPAPQILEAPTKEELRNQKSSITESYRKLGRARPDLQATLQERRRSAAEERRAKQADEGAPYRVRPRHA